MSNSNKTKSIARNTSYLFVQILLMLLTIIVKGQSLTDTIIHPSHTGDSNLRIINLNPYFTQNVDSVNVYKFNINKDPSKYYWYLKNAPVGLSINKDNGQLRFKAA